MTFEVVPLEPAELEATALALAASFEADPLFHFLAPDQRQRSRWLPVTQAANLRMTLPEGHTYSLRDGNGHVVGGLCLVPPGRYPLSLARSLAFLGRLAARPTPLTPAPLGTLRRGTAYLRAWERMHVREPHWYLYNIGVAPRVQGRGAGRRLVEHTATLAERDGVPVYLETQNEANLPFYRRMGFEVVDRREPHPRGPSTWGMIRRGPPRPKAR